MDSKLNRSEGQEKKRLGTGDEEKRERESKRLGKRGKVRVKKTARSTVEQNNPWEVYISLTFTIIIITTAIIITLTTMIIFSNKNNNY